MTPRTHTTHRDTPGHPRAPYETPITSLHAGQGPDTVINAALLPLDLNAFGAEGAPPAPVALEVIPPPGPGGVLPVKDGRRQRVTDAGALVAALNAQASAARVDFDHRSEPGSPTWERSTEAEGWLSNYRLNHRGGIDADVELGARALERVRAKRYRYVSPALLIDADDVVVGLSSLALVNNPNMPLAAPSIHSESDMSGDTDPKALQARIEDLEKQLDTSRTATVTLLANAAAQAVERAVTAGRITPAQKDYHLDSIKSHKDGIEAGIAAFNAFSGSGTDAAPGSIDTGTLARRVGPTGTPPGAGGGTTPAFPVPHGWSPPSEERLALHARISEHARARGISYRDAVVELGATGV